MNKMLMKNLVQFAALHFVYSAPDHLRKLTVQVQGEVTLNLKVLTDISGVHVTSKRAPPTSPKNHHSPVWTQPEGPGNEKSQAFWQSSGQQILRETLKKETNKNVAKNLIILVADGMSIPTQMATRMYMGGEEKVLSFEQFPYVGLSKVRNENFSPE